MEASKIKVETAECVASTSQEIVNKETAQENQIKTEPKKEVKYFHCEICALRERYDYFGSDPTFTKLFKLLENAYVIEDPFVPPKQSEFIILGSHCVKCGKSVCKDSNCSLYYDGTYCIYCAKRSIDSFPRNVQEKLNRIVT